MRRLSRPTRGGGSLRRPLAHGVSHTRHLVWGVVGGDVTVDKTPRPSTAGLAQVWGLILSGVWVHELEPFNRLSGILVQRAQGSQLFAERRNPGTGTAYVPTALPTVAPYELP